LKHRLFIALHLPDNLNQDIEVIQKQLEKLKLPLQLESLDKLHLTLNFLGRVETEQIPGINKIISTVSQQYSPFTLAPAYLDSMYKKHADSFVYLGVSGQTQTLKELQKSLADSLSQIPIPQPEKFFPHITIARYKKADPTFIKSAMDQLDNLEFNPLPEFTVSDLTLYESYLSQKGSYFRRIGNFKLL